MLKRCERIGWGCLLGIVWLCFPALARAHGGSGTEYAPGTDEALFLTAVSLAGIVYVRRTRRVWQRLGYGRGVAPWRAWAFLAALLALSIALVSPLDTWSDLLFSAHMVQHILLMLVAAPLLVLGTSPAIMVWLLPESWRRPIVRRLHPLFVFTEADVVWPAIVWLLYALSLWVWHIPALYNAALGSEFVHLLEHAFFLGTAVLFWWTLAYRTHRQNTGLGLLFIFTTALHGGLLGVLLTFSRTAWYLPYAATATRWGISPLTDQQLGGAIMWVIAGFVYVVAMVALLHAWFRLAERREQWGIS